jgi:hypothetical protein
MLGIGLSPVTLAIRRRGGAASPTLSALTLSASTIAEGSAPGVTVGAVQGKTTGSTLSLTDDAGGRFALSGNTLIAGLVATDYETATSHEITIRETLAGATNTPRDTVLEITVTGIPATDYTITSDAEFTTLKALGGATLSGKSVLIDGDLGTMTFNTLSMASPLTFYQTPGYEVQAIVFDGDVSKTIWHGVTVQGQGWTGGNIGRFSSGAQGQHEFHDCTFRHGYTAALLDTPIDDQASIPEIQKPQSSGTATTTSSRIALPAWNDDAVDGGWSNVQNTGAQTIYVKLGDGSVTVDTSITNNDTLLTWIIAPGAGHTFDGLDSPHPTHLAVITATGTSDVTVDMQQGLSLFQRDGWTQGGGVTWPDGGPKFIGCTLQDLNNGIRLTNGLVMDCLFERVYQDMAAGGGTGVQFLRNTAFVGWGAADHAQNPHGDFFQMSGDGSATKLNGLIAGNTLIPAYDKADAMQGNFISDNDIDPSFEGWAFVGNVYVNTPGHGITNGEALWPAKDNYVVANTVIGKVTDIDYNGPIQMTTGSYYSYLGLNIHGDSSLGSNVIVSVDNLQLEDVVGSRYAIFPDFDDLLTATTAAQVRAALIPAGAGVGFGVDVDAIDWTTTDPDLVVKWQNLPSGASWKFTAMVEAGEVQTTGLAPILNRKTGQTVVPGTGVEWRSVDTDGTTEVQAWTTSSGTIEPGQFIQIRFTATALPSTTDSVEITMNGLVETIYYTTAADVPSVYWTVASGSPNTYLRDTANMASGTTRLVGKAKIYMPSAPGAAFALFGQGTNAWRFEISTSRQITVSVRDSANTAVLSGTTVLDSLGAAVVLPTSDWIDIIFDVNHTAATVTVTINGVAHPAIAFGTAGTGTHRAATPIAIGSATSGGSVLWPAGTQVADVSVERNGSAYKTIANDAATVNADSWQVGADAT